MLDRRWDPSFFPPVTMRTWTEIKHHQPARPYLGLPHRVEAAGMAVPTGDVVGQLPGGHLAAEVVDFRDQGEGAKAATKYDGGGADLGEEESVEEEMEAGGLETNRRREGQRKLERERGYPVWLWF